MATISVSLPSDGQTADAADYNTPITTIVNEFNGNIDNNNIKGAAGIATSKLADDAGITTAKVADAAITPAKLIAGTGTTWPWVDWTPTLTNLSGGTITYSKYKQTGKTVEFRFKYTLGGAGVAGLIGFTLPVAVASGYGTDDGETINVRVHFRDTGSGLHFGTAAFGAATRLDVYAINVAGTYPTLASTSSTVPFTWANTDIIVISGTYEAT